MWVKLLAWVSVAAVASGAASRAMAADLPVKAPVYKAPAAVAYSWTGCHLGAEGGGIWGSSTQTQDDPIEPATNGLPLTNAFNLSGVIVGGTVGCDYQFSNWVVGIENDMSWTNNKGSTNLIAPFAPATSVLQTNETWLDTLRGRLVVVWDRWLVYGTGGAAFAQEGIFICNPSAVTCGSASHNVTGWTAGAGVEYAFWNNWSAKLEYLYVDLGKTSFGEIPAPAVGGGIGFYIGRDVRLTNQIFRAGINYKFDWMASPVMAKY
jgi:outer membrane immunogenic protein